MEVAVVTNTGERFAYAADLRARETVFMSPHFIDAVSTFQRRDLIEWERDGMYHPNKGQAPYRASTARLAYLQLAGWDWERVMGRFVDPAFGRRHPVLPEILYRFPGVAPSGFRGRFAVVEGVAGALKEALKEAPLANWETGDATSFFIVVSRPWHEEREKQVAILELEGNLQGQHPIERDRCMKLMGGRPSVGEQINQREELVRFEEKGRLLVSVVKVDVRYHGRIPYPRLREHTGGSTPSDWTARMIIYNLH
ncbi:MAG: hypothetical protein Q8P01_00210 [bacterium]|nr:hypothetical protein [bacterium]